MVYNGLLYHSFCAIPKSSVFNFGPYIEIGQFTTFVKVKILVKGQGQRDSTLDLKLRPYLKNGVIKSL